MNEAPKEIQVARSLQGPVSGSASPDHSVRPGVHRDSSAAHFGLPGPVSVGVDPGSARGHQFGQAERIRPIRYADARDRASHRLERPRWHRLIERWPNTFGWFVTGGVGATIIAIVQAIH